MTIWHDLGDGHRYALYTYHGEPAGAHITHPIREGDTICEWRTKVGLHDVVHGEPNTCLGGIQFDIPVNANAAGAKWQLVSLEPLHVEPSLACHCGDHGYIRDGKWESVGDVEPKWERSA